MRTTPDEARPALVRFARALRWGLLALFVYALLRTAWLCDDAFITFRVVDNAIHGFGLRWNVAERVQVYTHPLWLLTLIPLCAVTREVYFTPILLGLALSLATAVWIAFKLAPSPSAGALGLASLVSSRAFADYSTSGLENPLTHLLAVLFAGRVLAGLERRKDLLFAASLSGLALLNRPDTGLLFLPPLLWAMRGRTGRGLPILCAFGPWLGWLTFATFYYGFPLPNTAPAKLGSGLGRWELASRGLAYLVNAATQDPLTVITIVAAIAVVVVTRSWKHAAFVAGSLFHVGYVVAIGGDFMSGRFLSAPFVIAVVLLVTLVPRARAMQALAASAVALLLGWLAPYPVLASGARYGLERTDLVDAYGIADERGYYYWMTGLLNGRHGPKPTNEDVGRLRGWSRCGYPLAVEGAVGFAGYTVGPTVHVLDYHGLGDPLLARLPAVAHDPLYEEFCIAARGEPCIDGVRTGHYTRAIPAGYLAWLLGRGDRFEDPELARYVERLALVTRGPLFDVRRLREIAAFNLSRSRAPVVSREGGTEPRWGEVFEALEGSDAVHIYRAPTLAAPAARIEEWRAAYEACPDHAAAAVNLAVDLWREGGRDAEVIAWCERALEIDPWLARAFNGLGHAHARRGETDEALRAFERAIELDPTMVEAYRGRAFTLFDAHRWSEARTALEVTLRVAPPSPDTLERLAELDRRDAH